MLLATVILSFGLIQQCFGQYVRSKVSPVHLLRYTKETLSFGWSGSRYDCADKSHYAVQLHHRNGSLVASKILDINGLHHAFHKHVFESLDPGETYNFQVKECNDIGCGDWSEPKEGTTSGVRKEGPPPSNTSDAPDLCQDSSIDTVTRVQNGSTYFFKGDFYWEYLKEKLADGYPRKISDDWGGLEGNLDASFTINLGLESNLRKTYFFKGNRFWRFTNKAMDSGYPKLIAHEFKGIPDNVDAAFVWSENGKPYFFKGDKYWRYDNNDDPPVSSEYPQPISNWRGLPNDIDAAFHWESGKAYFFKAEKYYRCTGKCEAVDNDFPPYPRLTSEWWFICKPISHK